MGKNALELARQETRDMQDNLNKLLDDFTNRTGLVVEYIDADRLDVTTHGNQTPRFKYSVRAEIRVSA